MREGRASLRLGQLEDLVASAGGTSDAMKALMIVGAAAAGFDLTPFARDIALLRFSTKIDGRLVRALIEVQEGKPPSVPEPPNNDGEPVPEQSLGQYETPAAIDPDDSLLDIGMEV
jgi:hypothetical protein